MKKEVNSHRAIRGYESFSQAYQDLFVRLMTNFKSGGTYLEIGASDPRDNSNTYLLERDLKWTGISIEIDEELSKLFNLERLNTCMCVDATLFEYEDFLISKFPSRKIDYLSLDIDPSANTLKVLKTLPLEKIRFSVITFEHDRYICGDKAMEKSRLIFKKFGYVRVVSNVMINSRDFEDWYIDPKTILASTYGSYIRQNIEAYEIFENNKYKDGN